MSTNKLLTQHLIEEINKINPLSNRLPYYLHFLTKYNFNKFRTRLTNETRGLPLEAAQLQHILIELATVRTDRFYPRYANEIILNPTDRHKIDIELPFISITKYLGKFLVQPISQYPVFNMFNETCSDLKPIVESHPLQKYINVLITQISNIITPSLFWITKYNNTLVTNLLNYLESNDLDITLRDLYFLNQYIHLSNTKTMRFSCNLHPLKLDIQYNYKDYQDLTKVNTKSCHDYQSTITYYNDVTKINYYTNIDYLVYGFMTGYASSFYHYRNETFIPFSMNLRSRKIWPSRHRNIVTARQENILPLDSILHNLPQNFSFILNILACIVKDKFEDRLYKLEEFEELVFSIRFSDDGQPSVQCVPREVALENQIKINYE